MSLSILNRYFEHNGFQVQTDFSLHQSNLPSPNLYAVKKGKSMKIFPYGDYIFVYQLEDLKNNSTTIKSLHQAARKHVNKLYKIPKAFRITVPTISTVIISAEGFNLETIQLAQEKTASFVGGEFQAIFLMDLKNKAFYSQGISQTYVMGSGKSIPWRIEFKTIDPQNRTYYLLEAIALAIFKQS